MDLHFRGAATIRVLLAILATILVAGCATNNQITLAPFVQDPGDKLPPVTVFLKRPSDTFSADCRAFADESVLNHCAVNTLNLSKFQQALKQTGAFEDVIFADDEVDYRLLVTTAVYNNGTGEEFGNAVVSGATLMLAPLVDSLQIRVEASLYWYGNELKSFHYDIPFEQRASLFSMNQDTESDIASSVASYILHDLQSESLFTPQALARQLHSTDYDVERQFPAEVGDYAYYGDHIFTHPFRGIQVRYLHSQRAADFVDVFVYPVRSPYWQSDVATLLEKESTNIRRDVELVINEQQFTDLHFGNNHSDNWRIGDRKLPLLRFNHEYTDLVVNTFSSTTYLTIIEDKFVKLRHTGLKGAVDADAVEAFGKQMLEQIQVPPESLFMARVRKQWRDKEPL